MSNAERWMLRLVGLAILALFIVLALGHRPSGG
jgi:hypothetical protein